MIDRMSGRVSLLLVSVALIMVVLLGWFVLIAPQRSKAAKLDSDIGQTNVQLAAVTSLLQGPIGKQSAAALRVSEVAIPDDTKMSQILRQLSASASAAGIELDGVTPGSLVAGTGAEVLPITMNVKGRYFALQSFLRDLRSKAVLDGETIRATGRLYTVDSIQFSGQGSSAAGESGGGLVQATLAVNAFIYAPTAVPTAPTTTTTSSATTP